MTEERFQEVLAWWFDSKYQECVTAFVKESEKWQVVAAFMDILDRQGRPSADYFAQWLASWDCPETIQNRA